MVAFLAKPTESERFKQIVDFLNVNPIKYALMLQALVDGKKVIIIETSVRRDLQLEDVEGIECLPNADIFDQLALISTIAFAIICLATNQKFNFSKYIFEIGEGLVMPTDPHHIHIIQSSTSQPQNKKSKRKQRKDTEIPQSSGLIEPIVDEAANEENVPTQSNDPPLSRVNTHGSGEDRLKLKELMDLYTKLSDRVFNLETT
ncbi:hypothetical protein Tco_0069623, partial [Tanacetum coccineum]